MKSLLFLILLGATLVLRPSALADSVRYGDKLKIERSSVHYSAVHTHDWSGSGPFNLSRNSEPLRAFFTAENDFAGVQITRDGKALWSSPCPALTYLWISPDETVLVGLSNIMVGNPAQLVIWDLPSGKLIWREYIATDVARLSPAQREDFFRKYPDASAMLNSLTRKQGESWIIDFLRMGMPNDLGDLGWRELYKLHARHPYSNYFSSSVTNWIYWYREPEPSLEITKGEAGQRWLSLADPVGIRFRISLPVEPPAQPLPTADTPYPKQDFLLTRPEELQLDELRSRSGENQPSGNFTELASNVNSQTLEKIRATLKQRLAVTDPITLFTPTAEEFETARVVTRCVYRIVPALAQSESFKGSVSQLIGVKIGKSHYVLVNTIPMGAAQGAGFQVWHDGGPSIFMLLYDIETKRITRWHFNSGL